MATKTSKRSAVVTLPTDRQIRITREFDAPRHLLYKAWTTPELIKRWWSAKRGRVTVADVDLRVGGGWRYVMVTDRGFEVAFHGEYREIVPPERVVQTFEFEGMPGHVALETSTFEDLGDKTKLTITELLDTKEERDGMLGSGMEEGLTETHDRLEALLAELQKGKRR